MIARLAAVFMLALAASAARADAPPSAADIVAAADQVRNPSQPFRVSLALVEYRNGQPHDATNLTVHAKLVSASHQYRNLIRYVGPPRDVGKLVLLDASRMWFYDPASKASVRISAQQRLVGQASDGDVLTVNLAHDYTARLIGEEKTQDADKQPHDTWHLDLVPATSDATYARIETWIEKGTSRPIKSKFYSDSGRLLKLAYYRRYEPRLGAERPLETIIVDAVDPHLVTKISYSDFRAEDVEDVWFQRDYLPRFSVE
ncbi:MAG TPA: outer membrane lipoprotein-sorting protein [Polyangia bacterium]|nr:outer membrane lipoprotein-sorting protein [Polyangia bacterium]